jgi:hypothetical protein
VNTTSCAAVSGGSCPGGIVAITRRRYRPAINHAATFADGHALRADVDMRHRGCSHALSGHAERRAAKAAAAKICASCICPCLCLTVSVVAKVAPIRRHL